MTDWKPEYPGQEREPLWVWWERDEPEDGLTGFHTAEDRDAFADGKPGPFRRRLTNPGCDDIPQTGGWKEFLARLTEDNN